MVSSWLVQESVAGRARVWSASKDMTVEDFGPAVRPQAARSPARRWCGVDAEAAGPSAYWRTGGLWFEYPRFKVEGGKEIVCLDGVATSIFDEKSNRGTVGLDTGDTLRGRTGGPTVSYNTGLGSDIFQLERFLEYGK